MPMRIQCRIPFPVCSLWRAPDSGLVYRVVYSDTQHTELCPITGKHLKFSRYRTADLRVFTEDGYRGAERMMPVLEDPFADQNRTRRALVGHDSKSSEVWKRIRPLVQPGESFNPSAIRPLLDRATRGRLIRETAEREGVQVKTIHGDLLRYFQRGMTELAVRSDLPNCGRPRNGGAYRSEPGGKRIRRNYTCRPGRRAKSQRLHPERQYMLPGKQLTCLLWQAVDLLLTESEAPWLEALGARKGTGRSEEEKADTIARRVGRELAGAKRHGQTRRSTRKVRSRPTYKNVADTLNRLTRTQREVRDEQGRLKELELGEVGIITPRQVAYFCQSEPDVRAVMIARRHGRAGPLLLHGRADRRTKGPGDKFLLDATIGDIYLLSRLDRTVVVGRPTIYFLIDWFSQMIVALRVSLERPSYAAAASVIEAAVTPKHDFCARYGFHILSVEWPCDFLSASIVADRGSEFMAAEPWQRLARLGISISNCRPYTPTWRAAAERRWGSVPVIWQRQQVGVVERDWHEHGRPQRYPWDAIYTLSEFMTHVLRAVHVYHRTPLSGEFAHPELVFAREANTPLNRWRWGIENLSGALHEHSVRDIQLATWYGDTGLLTERGVKVHGRFYASRETEDAYLGRLGGKDRHVRIQSDPDELGGVWVELNGFPIFCPAVDTGVAMQGISWAEHQQYVDQLHENNREEDFMQQAERIRQMNDARIDTEIAKKRTRAALKDAGKPHPTSTGMSDARHHENALNRMMDAGSPSQTGPSRAQYSTPSDSPTSAQPQQEPDGSLREERDAAALKRLGATQEIRQHTNAKGVSQ
ncbi:transposase [Paraburkholderia dipogonis]|uniref:Transposase n=1 Tax=Paraburkholderia dipogonis TaxID=1211383 RepID=A0A4Y8MRS1_9BURK|nr:DDE-type integrase/transposase/recombinase [Paraburkholderia dipogonis]TFE40035.1 transposase [Paraburkholderia dipogonis]